MEEKKYIFPMNYKCKEKFLGIIDYKILKSTLVPMSKIYKQGKLNIPEE